MLRRLTTLRNARRMRGEPPRTIALCACRTVQTLPKPATLSRERGAAAPVGPSAGDANL